MIDIGTLLTGLLIFSARIGDVSIGTIRIIVTVQGRSILSFFLGIFELLIWITVIGVVIHKLETQPILAVFYAFGYATGNVVGIAVERKLAFGFMVLRVFTRTAGKQLANRLRGQGQPVTVFRGEGMNGPVDELYIACRRRDLKKILNTVNQEDPDAFYITEMARDVGKAARVTGFSLAGWRSVLKKNNVYQLKQKMV
ncbi:MAG: DUF2179 domain-containing protein [Deltaproteobacteria bacterium]|jgi:uncharacterized protein YebE (UPF0316 family)|nr:DUF2179 domain-containing protein [Deltaproteobacteria bacterium]